MPVSLFDSVFGDEPKTGTKMKPVGRKLRILIADDHALIRKKVRSILEENPDFEVCGEAINGAVAVTEAQS
jgi:PleD family two-component response regulator